MALNREEAGWSEGLGRVTCWRAVASRSGLVKGG